MGQCITLPSHLLEGGIRDPGRELPQNAMNVSRGCVGEALKCVGTPLGCGAAICGAGSERRASHRAQGEQYQAQGSVHEQSKQQAREEPHGVRGAPRLNSSWTGWSQGPRESVTPHGLLSVPGNI